MSNRRYPRYPRPLDVPNAIAYLENVKSTYSGDPETYLRFLSLVLDWRNDGIDTADLVEKIAAFFQHKSGLLRNFNALLTTSGYRIECSTDQDEVQLFTLITPDGAEIHAISESTPAPPDPCVSNTKELLDTLRSDHGWDKITHFRSTWASCVLQLLQTALDDEDLNEDDRKTCLRGLRTLAQESGNLPPSFLLRNIAKVGNYAVKGGGFADIYEGRINERTVCCKVLRVHTAVTDSLKEKLIQQFSQEALMWRQLQNPFVLPFYGVSKDLFAPHPSFCLISPWMANGNIMDYLEKNPDHDRLNAIVEVAQGLRYLHGLSPKIVHGDIKGANVLVTDQLTCVLGDFGLASIVESRLANTSMGSKGTMPWMAPELIDHDLMERDLCRDCDSQIKTARDIYAFACTMYEILTGSRPFPDLHEMAVGLTVITGTRPGRPSPTIYYPDDIWSLTESCWAQNPRDRSKIDEVTEALQKISDARNWSSESGATLESIGPRRDAIPSPSLHSVNELLVTSWLEEEVGILRPAITERAASPESIIPSPTQSQVHMVYSDPGSVLPDNRPDVSTGLGTLGRLSIGSYSTTFATDTEDPSLFIRSTSGSTSTRPMIRTRDHRSLTSRATSFTSISPRDVSRSRSHTFDEKDHDGFYGTSKEVNDMPVRPTPLDYVAEDLKAMEPSPFQFRPRALASMLDPKNLDVLQGLGGTQGLLDGLGTNFSQGLCAMADDGSVFSASLELRRHIYGKNCLPLNNLSSFWWLVFQALEDKVTILLTMTAIVSLTVGLYEKSHPTLSSSPPPVNWVEGVAIIVAILFIVVMGAINDFRNQATTQVLERELEGRTVKVRRDGVEVIVDVKDVVVGDIGFLESGEIVPCDAVYLEGRDVVCDEHSVTGQSDLIRKIPYQQCILLRNDNVLQSNTDCFLLSGTKVLHGFGVYVVVAVGVCSFNGRIKTALGRGGTSTRLQLKLNNVTETVTKWGTSSVLLFLLASMIKFFVELGTEYKTWDPVRKGSTFVEIFLTTITLLFVAVPQGLPLLVVVVLSFATKRMMHEGLLARSFASCERVAATTTVCVSKTGILTQNKMTVVAGCIGIDTKFIVGNDGFVEPSFPDVTSHPLPMHHPGGLYRDQSYFDIISPHLWHLFHTCIAVNSSVQGEHDGDILSGSQTETALLKFVHRLWADAKTYTSYDIIQLVPFSTNTKTIGAVVQMGPGRWRLYLRGAGELLATSCVRSLVDVKESGDIVTKALGLAEHARISQLISAYANQGLRTVSLSYKDFAAWPPEGAEMNGSKVSFKDLCRDLTLIGILGINDPLDKSIPDFVQKCAMAGVMVRLCTGEHPVAARSVALESGIFTPGGLVMEGSTFRRLKPQDIIQVVPRLQVLARATPEDKTLLLRTLASLGESVSITGHRMNDAPALERANIGFSFESASTGIAREASNIIVQNDNVTSIIKSIAWGRCARDSVSKILQFQLSTSIAIIIITTISSLASKSASSGPSVVQLVWISIIMDVFAVLALGTDQASEAFLDRKPPRKKDPLISVKIYKQILFQSTYQIAATLMLCFGGWKILDVSASDTEQRSSIIKTTAFNTFVFMQIFNLFNCRRIDGKFNIFEGIHQNHCFIIVVLIEIIVQTIVIFFGGIVFKVTRIGGLEWGITVTLGFVSIPLGSLVRFMPDDPFQKLFQKLGLLRDTDILPTVHPDSEKNSLVALDNLRTFAAVRGGRVRSSPHVTRSRAEHLDDDDFPFLMSSIDPASFRHSSASRGLKSTQLHPDTVSDDPIRSWFPTRT